MASATLRVHGNIVQKKSREDRLKEFALYTLGLNLSRVQCTRLLGKAERLSNAKSMLSRMTQLANGSEQRGVKRGHVDRPQKGIHVSTHTKEAERDQTKEAESDN